jgi:hypothetical protein
MKAFSIVLKSYKNIESAFLGIKKLVPYAADSNIEIMLKSTPCNICTIYSLSEAERSKKTLESFGIAAEIKEE